MDKSVSKVRVDTGIYLCHLIKCAIDDRIPDKIPENVNLKRIYTIARHNSIEGVLYYSVSKLGISDSDGILEKWKTCLDTVIFRLANFDAQRETILKRMSDAGLSYITLKGINLIELYPMPGMRSMADNDILFGFTEISDNGKICQSKSKSIKEASDTLKTIMEEKGFTLDSVTDKDDIYHKPPFYNFEMHKALASDTEMFFSYYKDPWIRSIPVENGKFSFSAEDEYIYNIVHMYKHFSSAGCGIRHITDLYVIHKRLGDKLDFDYIKKELDSLGILDFYLKIFSFTDKIFEDRCKLNDEEKELLLFFIGCGTFGNMEGYIYNRMNESSEKTGGNKNKAKFLYILKRIFPGRDYCKKKFPFFYKYPIFIPFLYIFRIFRGLFFGLGRISKEFSKVIKK